MSRSAVTVSARSASSSLYRRRRSSARISVAGPPGRADQEDVTEALLVRRVGGAQAFGVGGLDPGLLAARVPGLRAVAGRAAHRSGGAGRARRRARGR